MKKILLLLFIFVGTSFSVLANKPKVVQIIEKKNGALFLADRGQYYQVDTTIITVKKIDPKKPLRKDVDVLIENKLGFIDIKVPKGIDIEKYAEELKKSGEFEIVEFVSYCKCCLTPNDSPYGSQLYLDQDFVYDAWDITTGNPNIKIAVIDTGVDANHPDLGYGNDSYSHINIVSGWDYSNNTAYSTPIDNHGTLVAGIIGAKTNNSIGMSGIVGGNNSSGTTIIPYCLGSGQNFTSAYTDDAIIDAVDKGVKVICFAFIVGEGSSINAAISYAYNNGVSIVCPTGNGGQSSIGYPASHELTIAVGAYNNSNQRLSTSNYGVGLDLVAPGENLYSTSLNSGYEAAYGTSIAVPQVVGTIALMLSVAPNLTPLQIRTILNSTTRKIISPYSYDSNGWNEEVGFGRLYTHRALLSASATQWNVQGPIILYNSGIYSISGISNNVDVTWSLSGNNASNFTIQNNYPSTNQCTITRNSNTAFNGSTNLVLTAALHFDNGINSFSITPITKNLVAPYISGTSIPCNTENYHVKDLPGNTDVSWSVSGLGLTGTQLHPGYLIEDSINSYYVSRTAQGYASGTVSATVQTSENTTATLTKRIDTGGNFTGTWYQIPSTLNPDTSNSSPAALQSGGMYILNKSQSTVLQSSDFIDASITTNCNGMTLLSWSNPNNGTITFIPTKWGTGNNIGSAIVEGWKSSTCETFRLNFSCIFTDPIFTLGVSASGQDYTFTLQNKQTDENGNERTQPIESVDQPWKLSVVQYDTGLTVYENSVSGTSMTVNASRWKPGIYIVIATIGDDMCVQKITVK